MSYENIEKVPVGALKIGEIRVGKRRSTQMYSISPSAMAHVINTATEEFFKGHPDYLHRRIGVIPEREHYCLEPPLTQLFIAFYDLEPEK